MSTKTLAKLSTAVPSVFDDFFKPWNEWFDGGFPQSTMRVPAVNITEEKNQYHGITCRARVKERRLQNQCKW